MYILISLLGMSLTRSQLTSSSLSCDDQCLIACAHNDPACASVWDAPVPISFTTRFLLESGKFFDVIVDNSSIAFPMSKRFFILSKLNYFMGSPFYRVLRNSTSSFVAQVGYRGNVEVDQAWLDFQTSNDTVKVLPPGNIRGTVAFGTNEVPGPRANCTASFCSLGFSVELFINTADNMNLDDADFSPFGRVDDAGMQVVDNLYSDYGELSDLCANGDRDGYCVSNGNGSFRGVNLTYFLKYGGNYYICNNFPKLDAVSGVFIL